MKKRRLGGWSYVLLWTGLLCVLGFAWLRERALSPETPAPSSAESASLSSLSSPPPEGDVPAATAAPSPEEDQEREEKKMAGVWVPYLSLTTEEGTRESFLENFRNIADTAAEKGCTALFVHVRPFCDALYPSELFPWSHVLTGEQGKDPGYDPLREMLEYTHQKGMEFHAWINPLRVTGRETPETLSPDNPFSQLREDAPYYFMEQDGCVWLDPAYPYVRDLIAQGVGEIARRYDVDGVHFDDYFYPSEEESLDEEAYRLYTSSVQEPLDRMQWRMANIDTMVAQAYRELKKARPKAVFGISPQGNLANDRRMGADVDCWCAVSGYVDYLCPQLYYSFDHPVLGYSRALEEWDALPRREGLKLYAGLALYKAGSDADQGTWEPSGDVIRRQIEASREAGWDGIILYSSDYLDAGQTEEEIKNAMAVLQ